MGNIEQWSFSTFLLLSVKNYWLYYILHKLKVENSYAHTFETDPNLHRIANQVTDGK